MVLLSAYRAQTSIKHKERKNATEQDGWTFEKLK